MGFIKILTSLGFLTIFTLAIVSYMVGFANDNEVSVDLSQDTELTNIQTGTESYLLTYGTTINESSLAEAQASIESGDETLESGGIFKNNPKPIFDASKNIIKSGYKKIFGSDENFAIVMTTLTSFLVLIIGLYIWKIWKGGDPD
jgi:hypothetical protein